MEPVWPDVRSRYPTAADQSDARFPAVEMAPRRDVRQSERGDGILWRAVDHEGEILKSYVTQTRDKAAALQS